MEHTIHRYEMDARKESDYAVAQRKTADYEPLARRLGNAKERGIKAELSPDEVGIVADALRSELHFWQREAELLVRERKVELQARGLQQMKSGCEAAAEDIAREECIALLNKERPKFAPWRFFEKANATGTGVFAPNILGSSWGYGVVLSGPEPEASLARLLDVEETRISMVYPRGCISDGKCGCVFCDCDELDAIRAALEELGREAEEVFRPWSWRFVDGDLLIDADGMKYSYVMDRDAGDFAGQVMKRIRDVHSIDDATVTT